MSAFGIMQTLLCQLNFPNPIKSPNLLTIRSFSIRIPLSLCHCLLVFLPPDLLPLPPPCHLNRDCTTGISKPIKTTGARHRWTFNFCTFFQSSLSSSGHYVFIVWGHVCCLHYDSVLNLPPSAVLGELTPIFIF